MLIVKNEKARCFRKIIARKINTRLEMRFKTGESLVKVVSFLKCPLKVTGFFLKIKLKF